MAYVYKHIRTDTNEVFYIGIGSDTEYKRANNTYHRSTYWKKIVNKAGYVIEIVEDGLVWDDACKKEIELIKYYGRKDLNEGTLINMTNGGEGALGCIPNKQTREKMSQSKQNMSNETKEKMSQSKRNMSAETKLKMSVSHKLRWETMTDAREAFAKINKGRIRNPFSDEHKLKMSEARKGKPLSDEHKQNLKKAWEKRNSTK
jgi:hypothetical protein